MRSAAPPRSSRSGSAALKQYPIARPSGGRALQVEVVGAGTLAHALSRWLRRIAPATARGQMTVALVPDSRIQELNRTFRQVDEPTDVLSFPADEPGALGDVVIARGVARQQARGAGHDVDTEIRVLALHGLLHLLGYDHEHDGGRMARLEARLRRKGGLREGLIERAVTRTTVRRGRR